MIQRSAGCFQSNYLILYLEINLLFFSHQKILRVFFWFCKKEEKKQNGEKKIIKKNSLKVELVSKKDYYHVCGGEMYVNRTKKCICELIYARTSQNK